MRSMPLTKLSFLQSSFKPKLKHKTRYIALLKKNWTPKKRAIVQIVK